MKDLVNKREASGIVATMRLATMAGLDVRQALILFAVSTAGPDHLNASQLSVVTGIPRETTRRMLIDLMARKLLMQIAGDGHARWSMTQSAWELVERVLQGMGSTPNAFVQPSRTASVCRQ